MPTFTFLLYLANRVQYVDEMGYMYRIRTDSLYHQAPFIKNALACALSMKDCIEWFKDKPQEYRDMFSPVNFMKIATRIENEPIGVQSNAARQWPEEWKEYKEYYNKLDKPSKYPSDVNSHFKEMFALLTK